MEGPGGLQAVDRRRVASPAQMEQLLAAIALDRPDAGTAPEGAVRLHVLRHAPALGGRSLLLDECTPARAGLGAAGVQRDQLGGRARLDRRRRGPRGTQAQGRPDVTRSAGSRSRLCWSPCSASTSRPYGTAPDGRLFQTYRGGIYPPSTLWHVLRKAREQAFTPAQLESPLVRKPYDFRHAGVSWRLNAGAPAPLVAEWAGHTVEVLLRIYAHCIDGDDDRWHKRMEDFLG